MSTHPANTTPGADTTSGTVTPGAGPPTAPGAGWLRRLWEYASDSRRSLLVAVAAAVLGAAAQLVVPLVERHVVDTAVLGRSGSVAPWLVTLLGLGVVVFVATRARRFHAVRLGLDVQYRLRNAIATAMQRTELIPRHRRMTSGQVISHAGADITLVLRLTSLLPTVLSTAAMICGAAVLMFSMSPLLTLTTLVMLPLIAVPAVTSRRVILPTVWDMQQRVARLTQVIVEGIRGGSTVRAYGSQDHESQRFADAAGDVYAGDMRYIRVQARYQSMLDVGPLVGQVVALGVGGFEALRGTISLGTYLAFASYLTLLAGPCRFLVAAYPVTQAARAGLDRVFGLLDTAGEVAGRPREHTVPRRPATIRFQDVWFTYPGGTTPVLAGFDLEIPAGSHTAVVGLSGSGKSTVATLLAGLADADSGAVTVDGTDLGTIDPASLHQVVGVAFTDPFLFAGTIRENIAFGRPDATDAEIARAAWAADIDGFVGGLPRGYDTTVAEAGASLSGGQRQRIALARTLLAETPVLVLDDATSAVDSESAELVEERIRALDPERTIVTITNRYSALRHADRVALLDGGRVLDVGAPEELLDRCEVYRSLVTADGALAGERRGPADGAPIDPARLTSEVGPPWSETPPALLARARLLDQVRALPAANDRPVDDAANARGDPEGSGPFRLRSLMRPVAGSIGVAAVVVLADTLLSTVGPFISRQGIDNGVLAHDRGALLAWTATYAVAGLLDLVAVFVAVRITGGVAERMTYALRRRLSDRLYRSPLSTFAHMRVGDLISRMTGDVGALYSLLQDGVINAGLNIFTAVGVVVFMFVVDLRLALMVLLTAPLIVVATVLFRRRIHRPYQEARERLSVVISELNERLLGGRDLFLHDQQEARSARFRRAGEAYRTARTSAQRLTATYFAFIIVMAQLATVLALWRGTDLVRTGEITPGELIGFLLYISLLSAPIQQLSTIMDDWMQARVSVSRIRDVLTGGPVSTTGDLTDTTAGARRGPDVRFDDVVFAYPRSDAEAKALDGVTLRAAPGRSLAVVGPSGSGKTTIMNLVARLHDASSGVIHVDGVDVRESALPRRPRVGHVPQDSFMFTGTVAQNIAYGRPGATLADVIGVARSVGIDELLRRLPDGYDTVVGDGLPSISRGEAQLIAIARAFLMDPDIVLLDEATANLDPATEARIASAVEAAGAGRTVVVIAHRFRTARRADEIVVVEDGRVVECGTHDELLETGGRYAAQWSVQGTIDAGPARFPDESTGASGTGR